MLIFGGDPTGFITRPISGTILAVFVLLAVLPLVRHLLAARKAKATKDVAEAKDRVDV